MIIAEFDLDHPILREAMNRVPEMQIVWERSNAIDESRVRILVWAEGGDFEAFEDALVDDPTVEPPTRIIRVGDRRLYQTELAGEGLETSIYPLVVDEGGVIHNLTANHEGWSFRVSFPDRASVDRFYAFCRENGIGFDLQRMYQELPRDDVREFGLTTVQRETLVAALEVGYLEIPRESTLAQLADHLDVSENAASERFRRAVRTLLEHSLGD